MNPSEQKTFSIKEKTEKISFGTLSSQSFLKKWAEINDGTEIEFLERKEWEEKKKTGFFQKKENGKMILFLPQDLHLWEMAGIMEEIDRDTFIEKPERAREKKEEMEALGKMFMNTASYLSERNSSLKEGKEIAEAMAEEFYSYGKLLSPEEMPVKKELTEEETAEVDKWILSEDIVLSRLEKIEDKKEKEEKRREALSQFFRVAQKAFALQNRSLSEPKEKAKPWESTTPVHSAFLQKIDQSIQNEVEKPKWELDGAMFRRGVENLLKNLEQPAKKEIIGSVELFIKNLFGGGAASSFSEQNRKLVESLHLSELKKEMEEVRKSGDLLFIGRKETELSSKIQQAVSSFRYRGNSNNPAEIILTKYINCVGASIIGGALLSEIGINYLVGSVPEHSFLFFVTSDDRVVWQDMLAPHLNEELHDSFLSGVLKNGNPITVSDIVAFSKNPSVQGFTFEVKGNIYEEKMPFFVERERKYITLFPPKEGQQIQLLGNTADALIKMGKYEEAVDASREALTLSPDHPNLYNNFGYSLMKQGRNEEAIAEYKKALALDPEYHLAYNGIGQSLYNLGNFSEAKETFEKEISLNPHNERAHYGLGKTLVMLGDYDEKAEQEFLEAISLNDRFSNPYFSLAELLKKEERNIEAVQVYQDFLARADEEEDAENIKAAKDAIKNIKN
ncbi:MAG: tetratricopeptide repeat protein [Candidatus Parcubacteria bacterium]|nr:tetratricopeptide repeat protein [Candidatus Parcubacteria bacterium]